VHVNEKGGSFGGTEEYIALVTCALSARGVRSHLVCGIVAGALPDGLESVHIVEGLASRQSRPGTGAALAEVIAELDADVIYLHNLFDPAAVSAVATLARRGMLIWYVHDHYLTCLSELRWRRDIGSCPQRLGHDCLVAIAEGHCVLRHPDRTLTDADLATRMTLSQSLAAADAIVVVSDYMRTLLSDAAPHLDGRLHLLTRPIRNLGDLRLRHRNRPDDPAVITYAGRIAPEKGLAVVIEALGSITTDSTVELRIAGVIEDDSYWSHCQHLETVAVSRNPRLSVIYLGHLDYDATDEQLRQADIVTIPSQWPEPLGAVALEAMSAGAAVIASSVGGLNTSLVHDHNGLHVDPPDVNAWADAIASLLQHPEHARRLGCQAHRDLAGVAIGDHLDDLDHLITTHPTSTRPHPPTPTAPS
jgi:glycosyltransferase involved in cell wall biosynthesis